ncbi:VOC family protein [Hydrogenophaga sp. 2FB]|uniref:VOC family protein n=1 Tax=Hydrogenophaga sp. 2FB TaxID=2502187 RepID=UPI0010F487BC|nr:VOC family protein [Hydrogenophaga sp. 2FB]
MAPDLFRNLHHVCIVVRDMTASVRYYESIGVGPWHDFPSLETFRHDLQVPDADAFLKLHYRYANLDNVQLQLCEPAPGNTPQRRFLETQGEGVFHLGFTVPDCDAAESQGLNAGLSVLMHGRKPDGGGFTYFETAHRGAGVTLEVRAAAQ